jgi:hypothetical protein
MAKSKKTATSQPRKERKPNMPESRKTTKPVETFSELFLNYADASRHAHVETQKQYYGTWRDYLQSVRDSFKETPVEDAARAYAEMVQRGIANPYDVQSAQTAREFADAAQSAEVALRKALQDCQNTFQDEIQKTAMKASEAQKSEVENLLTGLRDTFCGMDVKDLDAAKLGRIGYLLLVASWLRAQTG